jgi:hypothetical protein
MVHAPKPTVYVGSYIVKFRRSDSRRGSSTVLGNFVFQLFKLSLEVLLISHGVVRVRFALVTSA